MMNVLPVPPVPDVPPVDDETQPSTASHEPWPQQAAAKLLDGEYRRHFTDLCELIIPLPFLPVQREIVARLDAARERKERLVSAAKRGREAAALWRKAILKEAFE